MHIGKPKHDLNNKELIERYRRIVADIQALSGGEMSHQDAKEAANTLINYFRILLEAGLKRR